MSKRLQTWALLVLVILVAIAVAGWYELRRSDPQPAWIDADARSRFLYGWTAGDGVGVPYWIWLALPRMFPEYIGKPGGYAAFGVPWEEGREMPAGFAKKRVGYVRVAGNCALCHAASRANGPDLAPAVLAVGSESRADVPALLTFFKRCAEDPRFTADDLLGEIHMATKLSFIDELLYRFVLIPRTRRALLEPQSALFDAALWRHAQDPKTNGADLRRRLETLQSAVAGAEKESLAHYLETRS